MTSSPLPKALKILLVEDNLINQKIAVLVLRRFGHQIDIADNGHLALDYFLKNTYDVVMMDISMPMMDGFETTRLMREIESERLTETPACIIAVTANAFVTDRDRCLSSGMDRYLSKPFTPDQLIEILQDI